MLPTKEELMNWLPENWEQACFDTHAIERKRKIKNPNDLMCLCLAYLTNHFSLKEIAELASILGIAEISAVAFMKKFSDCSNWFQWIIQQLRPQPILDYQKPNWLSSYRVFALDASDIMEKSAIQRAWHLHYAVDLFTLTSAQYYVTSEKTGETLKNFLIQPGDLVLADRAYGTKTSIEYCLEQGGHFIFRMKNKAFTIYGAEGEKQNLAKLLQ